MSKLRLVQAAPWLEVEPGGSTELAAPAALPAPAAAGVYADGADVSRMFPRPDGARHAEFAPGTTVRNGSAAAVRLFPLREFDSDAGDPPAPQEAPEAWTFEGTPLEVAAALRQGKLTGGRFVPSPGCGYAADVGTWSAEWHLEFDFPSSAALGENAWEKMLYGTPSGSGEIAPAAAGRSSIPLYRGAPATLGQVTAPDGPLSQGTASVSLYRPPRPSISAVRSAWTGELPEGADPDATVVAGSNIVIYGSSLRGRVVVFADGGSGQMIQLEDTGRQIEGAVEYEPVDIAEAEPGLYDAAVAVTDVGTPVFLSVKFWKRPAEEPEEPEPEEP